MRLYPTRLANLSDLVEKLLADDRHREMTKTPGDAKVETSHIYSVLT